VSVELVVADHLDVEVAGANRVTVSVNGVVGDARMVADDTGGAFLSSEQAGYVLVAGIVADDAAAE